MNKSINPNKGSKLTKNLLLFFIICIVGIEVNFGFEVLNIGNLIVFLGSLFVIILSLTYRKSSYVWGVFATSDFVLAFLLGIAYGISTIWSLSPSDTIVQTFLFLSILLSCYLLRDANIKTVVRIVLLSAFWVAIFSLIALLISRNYALQPIQSTSFPELRGIFKHQQRLGLFMCLALGVAIIAIINKEKNIFVGKILRYKKFYIGFITFVALFAFARLFMASAVLAFFIAFLLTKSKYTKFITTITFLLTFLYLYNIDIGSYFINSYYRGEISLTGRIMIWERSIAQAITKPMLGFGYAVFNSPDLDYIWSATYRPPHAHNSFVQAFFDGGWIGLILLSCLVYKHLTISSTIIDSGAKINYSNYVFLLALLSSLTGVTYGGKPSILYSFLFLFIAINPGRKIKHVRWI